MKHYKTLFLAAFLGLSLNAWAQPSQGSVLIGGSAGFNSSSFDEDNFTTIHLSPLAGFFLTDQLAVGASVNLTFYGGDDD